MWGAKRRIQSTEGWASRRPVERIEVEMLALLGAAAPVPRKRKNQFFYYYF